MDDDQIAHLERGLAALSSPAEAIKRAGDPWEALVMCAYANRWSQILAGDIEPLPGEELPELIADALEAKAAA